jgi:hypothetical protein
MDHSNPSLHIKAGQIADSLTAAYWTHHLSVIASHSHASNVPEHLAELADLCGYTLAPKLPPGVALMQVHVENTAGGLR